MSSGESGHDLGPVVRTSKVIPVSCSLHHTPSRAPGACLVFGIHGITAGHVPRRRHRQPSFRCGPQQGRRRSTCPATAWGRVRGRRGSHVSRGCPFVAGPRPGGCIHGTGRRRRWNGSAGGRERGANRNPDLAGAMRDREPPGPDSGHVRGLLSHLQCDGAGTGPATGRGPCQRRHLPVDGLLRVRCRGRARPCCEAPEVHPALALPAMHPPPALAMAACLDDIETRWSHGEGTRSRMVLYLQQSGIRGPVQSGSGRGHDRRSSRRGLSPDPFPFPGASMDAASSTR